MQRRWLLKMLLAAPLALLPKWAKASPKGSSLNYNGIELPPCKLEWIVPPKPCPDGSYVKHVLIAIPIRPDFDSVGHSIQVGEYFGNQAEMSVSGVVKLKSNGLPITARKLFGDA